MLSSYTLDWTGQDKQRFDCVGFFMPELYGVNYKEVNKILIEMLDDKDFTKTAE